MKTNENYGLHRTRRITVWLTHKEEQTIIKKAKALSKERGERITPSRYMVMKSI